MGCCKLANSKLPQISTNKPITVTSEQKQSQHPSMHKPSMSMVIETSPKKSRRKITEIVVEIFKTDGGNLRRQCTNSTSSSPLLHMFEKYITAWGSMAQKYEDSKYYYNASECYSYAAGLVEGQECGVLVAYLHCCSLYNSV
jgi:hypothetical protein